MKTLLFSLLGSVLLFSGCSRNTASANTESEQDGEAEVETVLDDSVENTGSKHPRKAGNTVKEPSLEKLLEQELQKEFSAEAIHAKFLAYFSRTLDDQAVMETVGDLRRALNITPDTNLDAFFAVQPSKELEAITTELTEEAREAVRQKYSLLDDDEVLPEMRKRNPLVNVGERIEFKTLFQRQISGILIQRTRSLVKVGSKVVIREDIPKDVRTRLWPEENEQAIQQQVRDELASHRMYYSKYIPRYLEKKLPEAFLKAGFLPDVFNPDASLKNTNPKTWVSRQKLKEVVCGKLSAKRTDYIRSFWESRGYEERLENGVYKWVKAPAKKGRK